MANIFSAIITSNRFGRKHSIHLSIQSTTLEAFVWLAPLEKGVLFLIFSFFFFFFFEVLEGLFVILVFFVNLPGIHNIPCT